MIEENNEENNEENVQLLQFIREMQNSLNRIRKNQQLYNYLKQISKNIDTAAKITHEAEQKFKLTEMKKMSEYKRWLNKQTPQFFKQFSKIKKQTNILKENYNTKDRILQKLKKEKAKRINQRLMNMIQIAEIEGIVFIKDYNNVIELLKR